MINMFFTKKIGKRGFSFVEAIFVLAIMAVVGIAAWTFQHDVFFLNSVLESSFGAESDARNVVKQFASEARTISQGSDGSYPIVKATATEFSFFADINGDGLKEKVHYFLSGNQLERGIIKPSGNPPIYSASLETSAIIVSDVANAGSALFDYFDSSYNGTGAPLTLPAQIESIRLVRMTIIIDKSSFRSPAPLRISTQVSIRNLKDNL
jgi:type II secretory pathway pseudopilin PulG